MMNFTNLSQLASIGSPEQPVLPSREINPPDFGYGNRYNSKEPKGLGFLGPLKHKSGGVMSEFSIGVNLGGQEMEIPSIVPTLSREEVKTLLNMSDGDKMPKSVVDKAVKFASERIVKGLSPFASVGEQYPLYRDIERAQTPDIQASPLAIPNQSGMSR
jgi:hypothetical protein